MSSETSSTDSLGNETLSTDGFNNEIPNTDAPNMGSLGSEASSSPSPLFTSNWVRQFGSTEFDQSYAIAIRDDQTIYLAGEFNAGQTQFADAFLASYTSSGEQNWLEEFGSSSNDRIDSLELTPSGQIVGGGITSGVPSTSVGETSSTYLIKYDDDSPIFAIEGAPDPNTSNTNGLGVAVSNDGEIYQVGHVRDTASLLNPLVITGIVLGTIQYDLYDSLINVYANDGIFVRQIDLNLTGNDATYGVAVDENQNVYFTGFTNGDLRTDLSQDEALQILFSGNTSAFLQSEPFITKFSPTGEQLWFQTIANMDFGEGEDIAIDSQGNIYVAGVFSTNLAGNIGQGNLDGFIAKYDTDGNRQWIKPIGSEGSDRVRLTIDESDRLIAAGYTGGSLFGNDYLGGTDSWLAHLDADGNVVTSTQFGTDGFETLWDVDTDTSGNIYVTGSTDSNFGGEHQGELDAWIAKYTLS